MVLDIINADYGGSPWVLAFDFMQLSSDGKKRSIGSGWVKFAESSNQGHMTTRSFVRICIFALLLTSTVVYAGCLVNDESQVQELGLTMKESSSLRSAFQKISNAAGIHPWLLVCDANILNAFSVQDDGGTAYVLVTTAIVHLTGGNEDELGALLGHELGHLLHDHGAKKAQLLRGEVNAETGIVSRQIMDGANRSAAIRAAQARIASAFTAFARNTEREADDEGFALTQKAGFSDSGQTSLYKKMLAISGTGKQTYLSTHPGWGERSQYSVRLELNEEFRKAAIASLNANDAKRFHSVVQTWVRELPDSGAAAYYEGVEAVRAGRGPADAAAAFERSVENYYVEQEEIQRLSKTAQAYQPESRDAGLALCVMLYREGRKGRTVSCLERLDDKDVNRFKKLTGWSGFILVGQKPYSIDSTIYSAKSPAGTLALTNCGQIAKDEGFRKQYSWAATRGPEPVSTLSGQMMECSRDLCDCHPVNVEISH